jgi:hypothetical protein
MTGIRLVVCAWYCSNCVILFGPADAPREAEAASKENPSTPQVTCKQSGRPGSNRRRPAWEGEEAGSAIFSEIEANLMFLGI